MVFRQIAAAHNMTVLRRFKAPSAMPLSVAVIASEDDLARALRLRCPPDLFELRLDALGAACRADDERFRRLAAPCVVTARHPAEGGFGNPGVADRRNLLLRFLPLAVRVDVELRSVANMRVVLEAAKARRIERIISVHAFEAGATVGQMRSWARAAKRAGADVFKLAVRVDKPAEMAALIEFFESEKPRIPISAMGIGKLGRRSRIELARRGSALLYAHLGIASVEGQLSLAELRRLLAEVAPSSARA